MEARSETGRKVTPRDACVVLQYFDISVFGENNPFQLFTKKEEENES